MTPCQLSSPIILNSWLFSIHMSGVIYLSIDLIVPFHHNLNDSLLNGLSGSAETKLPAERENTGVQSFFSSSPPNADKELNRKGEPSEWFSIFFFCTSWDGGVAMWCLFSNIKLWQTGRLTHLLIWLVWASLVCLSKHSVGWLVGWLTVRSYYQPAYD